MKKLANTLMVIAAFALAVPTFSGCQQAPNQRVQAYQTLKAVGQTADAAVATTAQFYGAKQITAAQARQVMDLYDTKFQPAYRLAVSAAGSDLSSFASPDLTALAGQLAALVASFTVQTQTK